MRRLLFTIVLIIIAFNVGAYVGKENMNKFYANGKKAFSVSKKAIVWAKGEWKNSE